jgi:hypothetical protein
MPTGTFQVVGPSLGAFFSGGIDWDTNSIKAFLFTTATTFNKDTTDFLDDVVAGEVTGTNWAVNGQTLTSCVVGVDTTNDEVEIRAADVSVASVTLSDGKHMGIVNYTPGTNATRHVIGFCTFDVALAPQGGTLLLDFNPTEGLFKIGPY